MSDMVKGKKIAIAVSGGIACYKIAEMVRELVKNGALVRVMMTKSAQQFVSPLTFSTLTGNEVLTDLFGHDVVGAVHIEWARWPDIIVVAPATANTVAKLANGLADNAVTTTILAATVPVLICPAMNKQMYANPFYQQNQQRLADLGYTIIQPEQGELACGEVGWGRLADVQDIIDAVVQRLTLPKDLAGKKIIITAGPTREFLDPVRFLSNRSSGKMGYALAARAACRGADVILISGPTLLRPFRSVRCIAVESAMEMTEAVAHELDDADVLIGAAAVSDYRPAKRDSEKIKRTGEQAVLELTENPDVLLQAAVAKKKRLHVGFAVETSEEIRHAGEKLRSKKLDFIVINNPNEPGAGFEVDTNKVTLLYPDGLTEPLELMNKFVLADIILDRIADRLQTLHR
jgi:phosphopantothenoylcysteine decarboxylase/phosphopantothenate--cysteine ligase